MSDSAESSQPPAGGEKPRSIGSKIGWGALILVGVVIAVTGLAWWLAAPRGELRLALESSIQADPDEASVAAKLFQLADSEVDNAQGYHERLSFAPDTGQGALVPMPPTESPGGHTLQKIVTSFLIETSLDQETGRIAVSIDGVALLEALYGAVGRTDYFLSIVNIEDADCVNPGVGPCYKVFARFHPSDERTQVFEGSVDEIARDLSVLVVTGVVRRAGDVWRLDPANGAQPYPYLLAASLPPRMSALEDTAKGIEILQDGTGHPACQSFTAEDCLISARTLLERAVDEKRGGVSDNPVAAFGLSLIATQEGLDAAAAFKADRFVEAKLQQAERLMRRARKSAFVREKLAAGFADRFKGLKLQGLALNEDFYADVGKFVCTLDAYRQADWTGCLGQVGEISDYPPALTPYLQAAKFYAELMHAQDAQARATTVLTIRQALATIEADGTLTLQAKRYRRWPLHRILVLNACIHPEDASEAALKGDASEFVNSAPDFDARWIAKAEVAGCPIGGDLVPAESVQRVDHLINNLNDEESRHRLELALAKYYVREGDFDGALALLKRAIQLPYVGPYVRSAPEFAPFMASGTPAEAFIDAYYELLPQLQGQDCQAVEL